MKNQTFLPVICVLLGLGLVYSEVVFSGYSNLDFSPNNAHFTARELASYKRFDNTPSVTLGSWTKAKGWTSGIDVNVVHALYDDINDDLYIGIECAGICGDVDGDGNPSDVDPTAPEGTLGEDTPNLCYNEQFSLMFWLGFPSDFEFTGATTGFFFPTMVVGVDYDSCIWNEDTEDSSFKAYEWPDYETCLWPIPKNDPTNPCVGNMIAGVLSPGTLSGYTSNDLAQAYNNDPVKYPNPLAPPQLFSYFPNVTHPHIEFVLSTFSKYPQQAFTPGKGEFSLALAGSSGSSADKNGEDAVYPTAWRIKYDCFDFPNGNATVDACGKCGGSNNTCLDCKGIPNGPNRIDLCNVCGGNNQSCADCLGVPKGHAKNDSCGVCNGDNSTCTCVHYLGYDLADVDYALLRWTVSASQSKIQDVIQTLKTIKRELKDYDYKSNQVDLSSYIDILHSFCDHCLDNFDYAQLWFAEYLSGACEGIQCQTTIELPDPSFHL